MYRLAEMMTALDSLGIRLSVYRSVESKKGKSKAEVLASLDEQAPLQPEEDGFLLREDGPTNFFIAVRMPRTKELACAIITGKEEKTLSLLTNFSREENKYVTLKSIPTYPVYGGYSTLPKDNGFRIISVADNTFRMFEVAIASRLFPEEGSLHFLTVQELYQGRLYYDEGTSLVKIPADEYPGYENWPSLKTLVKEMVNPEDLPRNVETSSSSHPVVTEDGRGRVLFFTLATARGKAMTKDGIADLHWTAIDLEERFPYVESGQEIIYTDVDRNHPIPRLLGVKPV